MSRPNFLFIITDSQSFRMVGSYANNPGLGTERIDRLAEEGIRFDRAYCPAPICTPCRAAIFSGIHAHTSGPWTNNLAFGTNIVHMGRRFRDLGYDTPYVGKWHLDGQDYFGTGTCPEGWDPRYWYDGKNYLNDLTDKEVALWRSGLQTIDQLKENNITEAFTWANRISNRGIDFLENGRGEKPFLMVLSYDEPHHPWTCPPGWAERYKDFEFDLGPAGVDDLEGKPAHQKEWAEAMEHPARQGKVKSPLVFGCNAYVDYEIGRVIDALDEQELENTYVVYCSDHGEMFGAHDLSLKGCVGYEEITHIPFIVRPPKSLGQGGRQENTLVNLIDVLPTFLDLAGEACPPVLQGESLKPLIVGEQTDLDRSSFIEFNRYEMDHDSFGGFKPMRAVVHGAYKLVVHLLGEDEFYHLEEDPYEMKNLINDPGHAAARDDLHTRLLDWMDDKRDPFRGPEWERRSWQTRRTRNWMGYYRPRPSDGYAPPTYDYDTGRPSQGVKIEAKTTPTE